MDYPPYKENKKIEKENKKFCTKVSCRWDSWGRLENGNGKKVLACSSPARIKIIYETCVYVVCALILLWILSIIIHSFGERMFCVLH